MTSSPVPQPLSFSLALTKRALTGTLTALIHASPSYHAVYRRDRESMLKATLQRTLSAYGIQAFEPSYKAPVYVLAHQAEETFIEKNGQALKHCFDQTSSVIGKPIILLSYKQYLSFSSLACVGQSHLLDQGVCRPCRLGFCSRETGCLEYRLLCFDSPGLWILPCNPVWGWAHWKASSSPWEALGAIEIC